MDSTWNVKSNRVERGWGKGEEIDVGTCLNLEPIFSCWVLILR